MKRQPSTDKFVIMGYAVEFLCQTMPEQPPDKIPDKYIKQFARQLNLDGDMLIKAVRSDEAMTKYHREMGG